MYITEMEEKNQKIFLVLKITGFEAGQQILTILNRIFSLAVNVLRNTPKI